MLFRSGATEIICSQDTRDLIVERGAQDMQSEIERFPRLFAGVESIPGLTWPTLTFVGQMSLHLGGVDVQIRQVGAGHTKGDTIAWIPAEKVLYSGDLVEMEAGVYTGDAHLEAWPQTLENLRGLGAEKLMPGRGEAMKTPADVNRALDYTRDWVTILYQSAKDAIAQGMDLNGAFKLAKSRMDPIFGSVPIYEHCMPFDVTRAYDEASGIKHPRIWTAERDMEMWASLKV